MRPLRVYIDTLVKTARAQESSRSESTLKHAARLRLLATRGVLTFAKRYAHNRQYASARFLLKVLGITPHQGAGKLRQQIERELVKTHRECNQ